jgi:hypothetical protein
VRYKAPPTVADMMRSNAFARVIKGPVGSGKTSGCVKEIGRRACEQAPHDGVRRTRGAVIRNTYRELKDTTRRTFEQWIPGDAGNWLEQDFTFKLDAPLRDGTRVESEILFRSLDRPEDIRKLLSLELTFAYINELREIPKQAVDVLETRIGRYPRKADGGPTWFGWWGDTNPWHSAHWGAKLFRRGLEGYELYEQPDGLSEQAENIENLPDGYYQRLCIGKDSEWIDVYVRGLDAASAPGSVYGRLLGELRRRNRVREFDHPADGVFTNWDLGYSDSTSIWWWRVNEHGLPDIIDHYEAHGQAMDHFYDVVDAKPYKYNRHWLPHDARQKSAQTGRSIFQQTAQRWPNMVGIVPINDVEDGIAAARWLLEQDIRIHSRCAEALETLAAYRYEWDEESQTFGVRPVHDFASHTADAFRYLACVVRLSGILAKRDAPKAPLKVPPLSEAITVDGLFEKQDVLARRRRI